MRTTSQGDSTRFLGNPTHLADNQVVLLSQTAIYAMRCLAVLRSLEAGERIPGDELSERTGVPREYLNKVMRQLSKRGITDAARGNRGGFRLNRPAARIRVADVLQAVDMNLGIGDCAFFAGKCNTEQPCSLHDIWSRLQRHVGAWANDTTLAEVDATPHM